MIGVIHTHLTFQQSRIFSPEKNHEGEKFDPNKRLYFTKLRCFFCFPKVKLTAHEFDNVITNQIARKLTLKRFFRFECEICRGPHRNPPQQGGNVAQLSSL